MRAFTGLGLLVLAAVLTAGCAAICKIPVVNQIPGVTCSPSPAPSPDAFTRWCGGSLVIAATLEELDEACTAAVEKDRQNREH